MGEVDDVIEMYYCLVDVVEMIYCLVVVLKSPDEVTFTIPIGCPAF